MNKSELREVANLVVLHKHGLKDTVARGLSALVRSARTNKSVIALLEYADIFDVKNHPDFIV